MSHTIHPSAVVDPSVELGNDVVIGPFCCIEEGSVIGDGTVLKSHVVIGKNVKIGTNNRLFSGCVIGHQPQVLGFGDHTKIGGLKIGNNNMIREHVTIHPSMFPDEDTIIGNENLLMIGVHLGHDCVLDDKIVMSNNTQISGHCKVGTGAWLSGVVAVHQFVTIGSWSYAAGFSGINHDVPPFVIVSGHYPYLVRSINKRGLARAGLDAAQQKKIFEAFKYIWRTEGPVLDHVKELIERDDLDENVRYMCDAIINSSKQRYGRHLELFRE